ncbi:MAG: hypothetical protein COV44_10445 [Deltaproteobacteria bacterium CG11_big_fil_rev_8_21_14_0_20_45_16]|nr:MAG: hypothetical protein COV44_10445 [Deltaproteobacteria bacterium CG11_big_fil_rev_8_21_14_0_20_45_16]
MLEAYADYPRSSVAKDLLIVLAWGLWVNLVAGLELPGWISVSGAGFLLMYGAYAWRFVSGAFYLMLASWIFGSLSLTLSGFYWLSLYLIFLILKLAQLRFMVRTKYQFAASVFLIVLTLNALQTFMLLQIYKGSHFYWALLGSVFASALVQAVIGLFAFEFLKRIVGLK